MDSRLVIYNSLCSHFLRKEAGGLRIDICNEPYLQFEMEITEIV